MLTSRGLSRPPLWSGRNREVSSECQVSSVTESFDGSVVVQYKHTVCQLRSNLSPEARASGRNGRGG